MNPRRLSGPRAWALLAVALATVGIVALVVALAGQQSPPQPAAEATTATPATTSPTATVAPSRSSGQAPAVTTSRAVASVTAA